MNQDDIIRMARKAGFDKGLNRFCPFRKLIKRFAVLVAAAERDRLMLAAERCIVCEQRRIRHEISTENAPNQ